MAALKDLGHKKEFMNYVDYCKGFRSSTECYNTYVKGYLEPHLQILTEEGKLIFGKKTITCGGK